MADARRLAAVAADEHDLGDRQRMVDVEDAARLDARNPTDPGGRPLARLGVALRDVDPSTTTLTPPADDPRRKMLRVPPGEGSRRMTRSTVPRLPASLPASTTTVSPLRISGTFGIALASRPSQHLRRERDDLHVVAVAQLARHRAEDARPARVALVVDQDRGVLVEADVAPVGAAVFLVRADDDRRTTSPFFTAALGIACLTLATMTSPHRRSS
jgi:hypothetical protein